MIVHLILISIILVLCYTIRYTLRKTRELDRLMQMHERDIVEIKRNINNNKLPSKYEAFKYALGQGKKHEKLMKSLAEAEANEKAVK